MKKQTFIVTKEELKQYRACTEEFWNDLADVTLQGIPVGEEQNIGFLRQWLNEDRITDPKKMITNEDLKHWLQGIPVGEEKCKFCSTYRKIANNGKKYLCNHFSEACEDCNKWAYQPKPQEGNPICPIVGCTNTRKKKNKGTFRSKCNKHRKLCTIFRHPLTPQEKKCMCGYPENHAFDCPRRPKEEKMCGQYCDGRCCKDKPQPIEELDTHTIAIYKGLDEFASSITDKINEIIKHITNKQNEKS